MGTDDAVSTMAGNSWNGKWVSFIVEGDTLNFKGGGGKVTVTGLSADVVKKDVTVVVKLGNKIITSVTGTLTREDLMPEILYVFGPDGLDPIAGDFVILAGTGQSPVVHPTVIVIGQPDPSSYQLSGTKNLISVTNYKSLRMVGSCNSDNGSCQIGLVNDTNTFIASKTFNDIRTNITFDETFDISEISGEGRPAIRITRNATTTTGGFTQIILSE